MSGEPKPRGTVGTDEIATTVRAGDRVAWLAALFVPPTARGALHALSAYRLELRRIVGLARDPLPAEIRLQWWRDAIRNLGYGEGAAIPLVLALRDGIARYGWPADTLCAMSEAHIHDLYADPFADMAAFDGYAGEAFGAPVQLAAMALCVDRLGLADGHAAARTAATAAGWAGVALAAVDAVQGFAARFDHSRTLVPADVWHRATGTDLSAALRSARLPDNAATAVSAMVARGEAADHELRALLPGVAREARGAFLPALTARRALGLARGSPLSAAPPSAWRTQIDLWVEARRLRRG